MLGAVRGWLSRREREILTLLAAGQSNNEIADPEGKEIEQDEAELAREEAEGDTADDQSIED